MPAYSGMLRRVPEKFVFSKVCRLLLPLAFGTSMFGAGSIAPSHAGTYYFTYTGSGEALVSQKFRAAVQVRMAGNVPGC